MDRFRHVLQSVWRPGRVLACVGGLLLSACATTRVDYTGSHPGSQCQAWGQHVSALVLWQSDWRPDQKEVPQREALAELGLKHFLEYSGCFAHFQLQRAPARQPLASLAPRELQALAVKARPRPDRVVLLTVKELGPVLRLFTPVLIEGGTEVVLQARVLKTGPAKTATALADFGIHWQNGGPWVIKGVGTLADDMTSALDAALGPQVPVF